MIQLQKHKISFNTNTKCERDNYPSVQVSNEKVKQKWFALPESSSDRDDGDGKVLDVIPQQYTLQCFLIQFKTMLIVADDNLDGFGFMAEVGVAVLCQVK